MKKKKKKKKKKNKMHTFHNMTMLHKKEKNK